MRKPSPQMGNYALSGRLAFCTCEPTRRCSCCVLQPRSPVGRFPRGDDVYACATRSARWRRSRLSCHCCRNADLVVVDVVLEHPRSSARESSDSQVPTRNVRTWFQRSPDQSTNASGCFFRLANHLKRQVKLASSTMSRKIAEEVAVLLQEFQDLGKALARQDPPLAPNARAIAEAKIATLQGQVAAMKRGNGHQPALSE